MSDSKKMQERSILNYRLSQAIAGYRRLSLRNSKWLPSKLAVKLADAFLAEQFHFPGYHRTQQIPTASPSMFHLWSMRLWRFSFCQKRELWHQPSGLHWPRIDIVVGAPHPRLLPCDDDPLGSTRTELEGFEWLSLEKPQAQTAGSGSPWVQTIQFWFLTSRIFPKLFKTRGSAPKKSLGQKESVGGPKTAAYYCYSLTNYVIYWI